MHRLVAVFALISWYAPTAIAQTQEMPPAVSDPDLNPHGQSTIHRHLGFLLRLDLGLGYMKSSWDPDYALKGTGGEFGLVLGGAVNENLILGGHLWGFTGVSPKFYQGSTETGIGYDTTNTMVGIGPNLTYYLMPANVYLSASPSITRMVLKRGGAEGSTDAGFGMHLAIGKEWWVGDHWGLGLAGQFMFSSNKDQGGGPTISSLAGALAFSATYN